MNPGAQRFDMEKGHVSSLRSAGHVCVPPCTVFSSDEKYIAIFQVNYLATEKTKWGNRCPSGSSKIQKDCKEGPTNHTHPYITNVICMCRRRFWSGCQLSRLFATFCLDWALADVALVAFQFSWNTRIMDPH